MSSSLSSQLLSSPISLRYEQKEQLYTQMLVGSIWKLRLKNALSPFIRRETKSESMASNPKSAYSYSNRVSSELIRIPFITFSVTELIPSCEALLVIRLEKSNVFDVIIKGNYGVNRFLLQSYKNKPLSPHYIKKYQKKSTISLKKNGRSFMISQSHILDIQITPCVWAHRIRLAFFYLWLCAMPKPCDH